MRAILILCAALAICACKSDASKKPPYPRPSAADIVVAYKTELKTAEKAKEKARAAAIAKAKAAGEEIPKLSDAEKRRAERKKKSKKYQVDSVKSAFCGWAPAKRERFVGIGRAQTVLPAAGYYCDSVIVMASRAQKKTRVFLYRDQGKWTLFQVDKKFTTPLKNFTQMEPAELAAYEAAKAESRKKKGKKDKKKKKSANA